MNAVETRVRALTADWQFLPPVQVTQVMPMPAPGTVGAYVGGTVFLLEGLDERRAVQVLGHELAHHGTRAVLGREAWSTFMRAIADGARRGDAALVRLRRHVQEVYIGTDGLCELAPIAEADEMAARLGELRVDPETGVYEVERPAAARFRAVVAHVARERLLLDVPATVQELDGMLLHAQDRMRKGRPAWDAGGWCYAGAMPAKPMGPKRPATSVSESESLLSGARSQETFWRDSLGFIGLIALVLAFGAFALAVVLGVIDIFDWMSRPVGSTPVGVLVGIAVLVILLFRGR